MTGERADATDAEHRVGDRYRSSRERLTALLEPLDEAGWETPVPACPGWRVRDVLAHLVGLIEDAADGRISGVPDPVQTATEVDRHRHEECAELLRTWSAMSPAFESAITTGSLWPAFIDVLSHEHDIRGALGSPAYRDHPDLLRVAELLRGGLPNDVAVDFGASEKQASPSVFCVRATHFEFFRLRLGRRSRRQAASLDWSEDPGPLLDRLFIFGPADADVTE